MSIQNDIAGLVRTGRLKLLGPGMPDEAPGRVMAVTPELYALLHGPFDELGHEAADRLTRLRADLEDFVRGEPIRMHIDPSKKKRSKAARDAFMGLLAKAEHGLFDIRSRKPSPGLRLLGGFAAFNEFVAFSCHPRSRPVPWLKGEPLCDRDSDAWALVMSDCMSAWEALELPARRTGSKASDFIENGQEVL